MKSHIKKSKFKFSAFLAALLLISCNPAPKEIVFHPSHLEQKQNAPFSDAVDANGFLFLAGQIGFDYNKNSLAEGGIKAETRQSIENIKAVLEHHGLTLDHIVKCTVILSDINDFSAFNEVYTQYFTKKPARTTFAASGLARNAKIEIEVLAVRQ
ncbi:RidA family protein [Leptobacterium flavescens]|uniref:RidA family protein n=1 Tax=Leptobacterium flavescens TaxID=472055 RepID=A0A6P0URU1_9FLAO|nr:Rid family detoxifying hydrolase [Leptobacterium flavescens]NER15252.1 RidA family protein [Leptobacterium flavescens]